MAVIVLEDPRQARVGDRLTGIDGVTIKPMKIDQMPVAWDNGTTVLHLEAPKGSQIEWQRYLDPGQTVTVERAEPQGEARAPRAKREVRYPRSVRLHGVRLLQQYQGEQYYLTEDRKYAVQYDEGYMTECDGPHPVRYSPKVIAHALSNKGGTDTEFSATMNMSWELRQQIRYDLSQGRKGYLCPGGKEHSYGMWELHTMDPANSDINSAYIDTVDRGDSMRDVLAGLPAEYGYNGR